MLWPAGNFDGTMGVKRLCPFSIFTDITFDPIDHLSSSSCTKIHFDEKINEKPIIII